MVDFILGLPKGRWFLHCGVVASGAGAGWGGLWEPARPWRCLHNLLRVPLACGGTSREASAPVSFPFCTESGSAASQHAF